MKWGEDYPLKPDYRKIFEAMVLIRFISLAICSCLIATMCICLVPVMISASATDRQSRLQSVGNVPVVGNLTHAFIDSKTRQYDTNKDGGEATCTICYTDFREEPEKVIAELNCSNKHIFHADCLKQWVANNKTCPLCKEVIPDKA